MSSKKTPFFNKRKMALAVALIMLAFITTLIIRIPIPVSGGYFNIGDVFVLFAALWLGPLYGLLVGALGPTLADCVGYPQFIIATAVTKGLEGLIAGLIAGSGDKPQRKALGAYTGGSIIIVGYFVFEAFIYPAIGRFAPFFAVTNIGSAVVEVLPNALQAIVGASVALGLWRTASGGGPQGDDQTSGA